MKYELKNYSKWKGPYDWGCNGKLSEHDSIHEDFSKETTLNLEVAIDQAKEYFDAPECVENGGEFDPEQVKKTLSDIGIQFKSDECLAKAIEYYRWRAEKFLEARAFLEAGAPGILKIDIPVELNAYETGMGPDWVKPIQEEAWISIEILEEDSL